MIIYIHGFASSGQATKAQAFRQYFKSKNQAFIAPSLPYQPDLAVQMLEELILSYQEDIYLIGSSLGGYYALYLSQMACVKNIVVINPAITPTMTLKQALGETINYYDNSYFSWKKSHIESLKNYALNDLDMQKIMLLLQEGDEILNFQDAIKRLNGCTVFVEKNGNHSFKNIESYFEKIRLFFKETLNN